MACGDTYPHTPQPLVVNTWQLCPKCSGNGYYIDTGFNGTTVNASAVCDLCDGQKIISTITGKPPSL